MDYLSRRASLLPEYAVGRIAATKRKLLAEGRDVIDLSLGDASAPPDLSVEALTEAVRDPLLSRYPHQHGLMAFREAVARYLRRRFGVDLDPKTEMLPLIGSKEGLAHLALAVLDCGDVCIVPEPAYPAYRGGAVLAEADTEIVPLSAEREYLVELDDLPAERLARARLVYLNYPNNPTAAVAPRAYLERTVAVCRERGIVLAYDNPYAEITFDGYRTPSVLEIPGARDVAVEFQSLSKTFGMTGWRIAWVAGNAEIIAALSRVKSWLDTGAFLAVQHAAAATLDAAEAIIPHVQERFRARRDAAVAALGDAGFRVAPPQATMYLWVPLPEGVSSLEFARLALESEAVAVMAGAAMGTSGEGFFRLATTVDEDRLREAGARLARALDRMGARR